MSKDQIKLYILLFQTIFVRYKFRMAVLAVLGFFNSVFDAIGIGLLIPLFSLVVKDDSMGISRVNEWVNSFFDFFGISMNITTVLVLMSLLFIGKAIAEFLLVYIRVRIGTSYENETRIGLYRKTLHAKWPYLLNQKIGYLENVMMTDVHATQGLFKQLSQTLPNMVSFCVYIIAAIQVSLAVTLLTMGAGAVILISSQPLFHRSKRYVQRLIIISKIIAHRVNETVMGMKTIKVAGVADAVIKREKKIFDELRGIIVRMQLVNQMGSGVTQPLSYIFIALVFAFSYKHTDFHLAGFIVVMYLIQRLFGSIRNMQNSMHSVSQLLEPARHILDLDATLTAQQEVSGGENRFSFTDTLEFRNVWFAYNADRPVLMDVSFRIRKNEMVGIIGPSGAGKTTVADLLLRLFAPDRGHILIDGNSIGEMELRDYRKHVGYVSQDMFLMNDTIESNIKFFSQDIDDARMVEAAGHANIYDFIMGLENGFKTIIGERGILLSGGQRQRIILARALAHEASLLILDEATSALDNESEALIQKSIEALKGDITVVVIAHRLSTIMRSDRLIALEQGKIIEEGTPEHLLSNPSSYFSKVYAMAQESGG